METVLLGNVYRIKKMKGFNFLHIESDLDLIQAILVGDIPENLKEQSTIKIRGEFVASKISDEFVTIKDKEFKIASVEVISSPFEVMPFDITKKELNINNDILFDFRAQSLKHPTVRAIFKIQDEITFSFRSFFRNKNFVEIRTPKIVKAGAEGGANIFELNYFGEKAYLGQSPQFYKEFMSGVFQKVYEIGPVFRAEKHNTSRHINEYTSMDIEFGPLESFEEIMNLEEELLKYIISSIEQNCSHEIKILEMKLPQISKIPRIKFCEVKKMMKEKFNIIEEDDDLSPKEELVLSEYVLEKYNEEFVFVTHYPTSKRPFYAKESGENKMETESFDLIFRGIEITTGGQRIHLYEELINKMKSRNMKVEEFDFFTNLHKFGVIPHGGFGMGLERLTQKLIGLSNVKEATMFPRDINRLIP